MGIIMQVEIMILKKHIYYQGEKMKRIVILSTFVLFAIAAISTGVVYAQGNQPPSQPRGPLMHSGLEGPMHDYMVKALAEAIGMDSANLESYLAEGETMYQIALAQGIPAEKIPTLLATAHSKALDLAAAAGVISQEQADWMKTRGFGRMGGLGNAACDGTGKSSMYGLRNWPQTTP
jgi:hypothetical protein